MYNNVCARLENNQKASQSAQRIPSEGRNNKRNENLGQSYAGDNDS